ncbi:MAG: TetR/AcrR family transcriptional regulator [Terriglobales bacterium]|jgi:AcrR family transcriptional regulator
MKTLNSRRAVITQAALRRQEQKQHRQEGILKAAFDVFAAHGYEAARIDEVAKKAGIAKGTIYLYFRDKDHLFRAVVNNVVQIRSGTQTESSQGAGQQLLRALLSRMYANVVRSDEVRSIIRMLVAESGRFPQLAEIYYQEVVVPGLKAVQQVLMRGVKDGEFRKTKALDFPQLIFGPALVAMLWQLLFAKRHPLDVDAYLKAHLEFVLRSLGRD